MATPVTRFATSVSPAKTYVTMPRADEPARQQAPDDAARRRRLGRLAHLRTATTPMDRCGNPASRVSGPSRGRSSRRGSDAIQPRWG